MARLVLLAFVLILVFGVWLAACPLQIRPVQTTERTPLPNTLRGAREVNSYLLSLIENQSQQSAYTLIASEIGRSQKGVPILMITITPHGVSELTMGGPIVVARQHGDEPAGTRAAVEFIRRAVMEPDGDVVPLLDDVVLRIVPIANPDGMDAFQRLTANGRDMNRDWKSLRLPETRAIASVIRQFRPDLLLDLHELTPRDKDRAHVIGVPANHASGYLWAMRSAFLDKGLSLHTRTFERHTTITLLHRNFAHVYGRPGFLVESKYISDPVINLDTRVEFHLTTIAAVLDRISTVRTASFISICGYQLRGLFKRKPCRTGLQGCIIRSLYVDGSRTL